MHLFTRAARRAQLGLAYSAGFNPRPRLALVSPRPVGVSCTGDLLVLTLEEECSPEQLRSRLADHLPDGVNLTGAVDLASARIPTVQQAAYSLPLSKTRTQGLAEKIDGVLRADSLQIERLSRKDGRTRCRDIRPYLDRMDLSGQQLSFTLINTDTGSAKPAEILALLGLDEPYNRSKLLRSSLRYSHLDCEAAVKQN